MYTIFGFVIIKLAMTVKEAKRHKQLLYLVVEKLASEGLKDKAHLLGRLQGFGGKWSRFSHFHGSYALSSFHGRGSVIHVNAWVTVTNQTSSLKQTFTVLESKHLLHAYLFYSSL